MNYTVGDFLIRIKNAYLAHKTSVELPYSKEVLAIGKILEKKGYIGRVLESGEKVKRIKAELVYKDRKPALSDVKIISRPSVHIYKKKTEMSSTRGGFGLTILSTSKGIMSGDQAKRAGVGGEIICEVY